MSAGNPTAKRQLPFGSCDEVETVSELAYPGDRVSAGGGCEAAVTARTGYGWISLGSRVSC